MGQRVLADFAGRWQLERRIVQRGGPAARFSGVAEWTGDGDALDLLERGTLHLGDQPPMQAERRYRWLADLTVLFEDGRYFHQVPAKGGPAGHWCAPDMYRVMYRFGRWPAFETVWRVRGPRKDYAMVSEYRRMG